MSHCCPPHCWAADDCWFVCLQDCCLVLFHPYRPLTQYAADMGEAKEILPLLNITLLPTSLLSCWWLLMCVFAGLLPGAVPSVPSPDTVCCRHGGGERDITTGLVRAMNYYILHTMQCLSQDWETVCLKLAVVKFLGVHIFKGDHNILIFQP